MFRKTKRKNFGRWISIRTVVEKKTVEGNDTGKREFAQSDEIYCLFQVRCSDVKKDVRPHFSKHSRNFQTTQFRSRNSLQIRYNRFRVKRGPHFRNYKTAKIKTVNRRVKSLCCATRFVSSPIKNHDRREISRFVPVRSLLFEISLGDTNGHVRIKNYALWKYLLVLKIWKLIVISCNGCFNLFEFYKIIRGI